MIRDEPAHWRVREVAELGGTSQRVSTQYQGESTCPNIVSTPRNSVAGFVGSLSGDFQGERTKSCPSSNMAAHCTWGELVRRVVIVVALSVLLAWLPVAGWSQPAAAITPGLLSAAVAPTWQTNAPVLATAYANGVLYVGGRFMSVRPPGAAAGTGEVSRSAIAAFNATTGDLLSFSPTLGPLGTTNPRVEGLTLSADKATLYVVGKFGSVNGQRRTNLAAFRTTDHSLTTWRPTLTGGVVMGVATAIDGTVYFGGGFDKVGGQTRTNAAAVDASGRLLPWSPAADGLVRSLVVSPDQSRIVLGGSFTNVNGTRHRGIVAVDRVSGAPDSAWGARPQLSKNLQVYQMTGDIAHVYISGVDWPDPDPGRFEGTASLNWADGSIVWAAYCYGDTKALALVNGVLYSGSHAHNCSKVAGGFPEQKVPRRLLAQRASDGLILPWFPNTNYGDKSGQTGPVVMTTDGTSLFVGGEFTTVNGKRQQGLARFLPGPDQSPPTKPGTPTAAVASTSDVQVRFTASWDKDDGTLTYNVYRDSSSAPFATVTADSRFWSKPTLSVTDTNVPSGSHKYWVTATDGTNTSQKSAYSNVVTVGSSPASYFAAVLESGPASYWRLGEPSGSTTANDAMGRGSTASYVGTVALGIAGALPDDADTAAGFNGSDANVSASQVTSDPRAYSLELWVKSTTTRGGKLVGFGNRQTGLSSSYDRHVYMTTSGQLVFGAYSGGRVTVASPSAYNDGRWHHVVATMGATGMALYVDGSAVASNPNTGSQPFNGYWRVGGDSLTGWPSAPGSAYFNGSIDEVAIYQYALTGDQVASHYALAN